jgi:hypothetical protein
MAGSVGPKVGPGRLREPQRPGRQADPDARGFRQGDGAFEVVLKILVGAEEMQRVMVQAIAVAKRLE